MNIALFTPNQNPYSETFIQAHKKFLKGKVFYYYGKQPIQLEGASSLYSAKKLLPLRITAKLFRKPPSFIRETVLLRSLKKNAIDVVLAEYGNHAHYILPIVKKLKLPLVVHFHGYDASNTAVIEKCHRYQEVFLYASKVIAVSRKMESMLLALGCPKEKLVYNVYGPQPEFMEVQPTYTKPQFLAVGRFVDKKAPYLSILAFKEVLKHFPSARLLMAGNGPLEDACKNLVNYFQLEQNVTFLGVIDAPKFRELLSDSIAFVQHSITPTSGDMEGTPLSILESSAAGLPVIATRHAGIPDVIVDGKTGLLCEELDVNSMTKNMVTLLNNPAVVHQMGAAGKENIKLHFSLERHIQVLQEVIESAL